MDFWIPVFFMLICSAYYATIINVLISTFLGISAVSNIVFAYFLGKKNKKNIELFQQKECELRGLLQDLGTKIDKDRIRLKAKQSND